MNKMINGKTKSEIMKELAAPFNSSDIQPTHDGFQCVSIQKILDRLDQVIGCLNYSIETIATEITDRVIYKTVRITIYYDDGSICCCKDGDGGSMFIFQKTGEENDEKDVKTPGNTNASACSEAIKQAARKLRIGVDVYNNNCLIGDAMGDREILPGRKVTGQVEEFKISFLSDFTRCGGAYQAKVKTQDGEACTLHIWHEDIERLRNMGLLGDLAERAKTLSKAKLRGVYKIYEDRYPQIIFKEVAHE
ncbi:MAG: hypothetical protein K6G88_11175 [Lachnospiraceae bacterium]|nr:hypothetical protein [Lachnospiraceae bacterium]